ncbi:YecA family protein [Reinekea sp.]|uniref:YecA family protein n=1 Tax=Reinekea sp. TaxID=1970455 RepID=UPI003988CF61
MKLGRNEPCPCGSGNKYKRCCMNKDSASAQLTSVFDDIEQAAAMTPDLSLEDLNTLIEHKMNSVNNNAVADFCGLTASQMSNWLYAPYDELEQVSISTPADLSMCPIMRYLELILEEAMQNDGSFKATSKGNLPAKIVKQASDILPEFAISKYQRFISISAYSGSNEDKFDALHYTRLLADLAGIIYLRSGRYHVKKTAQKQYQTQGIQAFFIPMLEAATRQYNWGYFDAHEFDAALRPFWLFMLWRLNTHASVEKLIEEMIIAFPDLVNNPADQNPLTHQNLDRLIELRFVKRFLEFWGLVTLDPKRRNGDEYIPRHVAIQPLLAQVFRFDV